MARKETSSNLLIKTPDQNPGVDIQDDEFRGVGGSYVLDPATGKRTRLAGPGLITAPPADEQTSTEMGGMADEI